MTTAGIGRMLVASLHQAVAEHLPSRSDFYAPWLHSESLRTPRVSVAGIRAALSFLRLEPSAYDAVVRRAGALAAEWTWLGLSGAWRAWLRVLPGPLRARAACRLARAVAVDAWEDTRVTIRWRRGVGRFTIHQSLFCSVRSQMPDALCGFYAAVLETCLERLRVEAEIRLEGCTAQGQPECVCSVTRRAAERRARLSVTSALVVPVLLGSLGTSASAATAVRVADDPVRPIVMPFDTTLTDPGLAWMGEGAALLITESLTRTGVPAFTRDERLRALERLEVPPLAALSRATVLRIGMLVGASDVVIGEVEERGDTLVVRARRMRLDRVVRDPELTVSGAKADFVEIFRQVARGLFGAGPSPILASGNRLVPAAFELYVRGLLADTMPAQVTLLQGALKAAPGYDAPRLALWQVFTAIGDHAAAREALRAVGTDSPRSLEAQFLSTVSLVHLGQYDDAAALLKGLHAKEPASEFLNNLGVLSLRRSQRLAGDPPASAYFEQARLLDPGDVDYVYNLGYAYWREGRRTDALQVLREAVRMSPADSGAHALVALVLHAGGQSAEAKRELELAQRLSSDFDAIDLGSIASPVVPRRMARLKTQVGTRQERSLDARLDSAGQQGQRETARYYLDRGRRFYEAERDREAERELDRAIYLAPYDAEAHLLLGRVYLRTGRVREAIDALQISSWCDDTADAQVGLAEALIETRDEPAARAALQRALALDPEHEGALRLMERISRNLAPQAV